MSKITQNSEVPAKIINENTKLLTSCIHSTLNEVLQSGNFPSCLKWADVTHIFINGLRYQVDNYGPVNILRNILNYLKDLCLNKCLYFLFKCSRWFRCGFRKGIIPQHYLLSNVTKVKIGALLTDLPKALLIVFCMNL